MSVSSPIHTFFNNLVQQEKSGSGVQQALFIAAANILTLVSVAAIFSLYYVLQSFLRPLLSAVLLGTFLYPFKQSATDASRQWVDELRESGTPLMISIALLPLKSADAAAELLVAAASDRYVLLIFISLLFVIGRLLYVYKPVFITIDIITNFKQQLSESLSIMLDGPKILGLIVCIILTWFIRPIRSIRLLECLSCLLWIGIAFHLIFWLGSLAIPMAVVLLVIFILGLLPISFKRSDRTSDETSLPNMMRRYTISLLRRPSDVAELFQSTVSTQTTPTLQKTKHVRFADEKNVSVNQSGEVFLALIWACIILRLWMHSWLLPLLSIPVLYISIKRIWQKLGISNYLSQHAVNVFNSALIKFECSCSWIIPKPLRLLMNVLRCGDRKAVDVLDTMLDTFISVVIILALLVIVSSSAIVLVIQIQQESVHLVGVTGNLINETVTKHPEFQRWLPEKSQVEKFIDSAVSNAFHYGKEWIRSRIKDVQSDRNINISKIEREVVAVLDDLYYKNWIGGHHRKWNSGSNVSGHNYSSLHLHKKGFLNLWQNISFNYAKNFDLKDFVTFLKENVDMFLSVLRSIMMIIRGNLDVALRLTYLVFSVIFGGGTALINLLVNIIVFLTALFYLLSSSENVYMPVKWAMGLIPSTVGDTFGEAVSEAIRGVFGASFKLAAFYGLYTWFTHCLFGVELVCIPSALAAVVAAVPFIGTYWVTVPAVLQLWLLHEEFLLAGLLFFCHCVPAYVIDIAVYREIKGGGHPYLTGLAVAGGIYCLGLEGAIVGPVLLCCFLVGCNVYSSAISAEATDTKGKKLKGARKQTLSRSLSEIR